jgi:putrescine carbamoyltransferase
MCDAIFARTLKHATITELAQHAEVPVINGLTDYNHPTQVVCDALTMIEHMTPGKKLEDLRVTFIGDATNVLSSLMLICTRLGMHFTHAAPVKYQAPPEWQEWAQANCNASGGSLTVTDNPLDAVMDHPRSIIFDQSENRLHVEKGLLVYFIYPRLKRPSEALRARHRAEIEALMVGKQTI